MALTERARKIKLVVLDVDGVLTDGSIWTGENGECVKRFNTRDGLGIKMLQAAGIPVAILTGRNSKQTAARCRELGIESVTQGKLFKGKAFDELVQSHALSYDCVAYMGDDVPDIPALKLAGLAACPSNASDEILSLAHFVSPKTGGNGAVRSLAELILKSQGVWDKLVTSRYERGEIK